MLNTTMQQQQNKEVENKLRELDSIYQTVALLEKELRAKADMMDLNVNSVKRNLELELSIQIKQMILPVQKNVDQYLQASEHRFTTLEDAVLNHMKRDSYVMTAERATRMRPPQMSDDEFRPGSRNLFENLLTSEAFGEDRSERRSNNHQRMLSGDGTPPPFSST